MRAFSVVALAGAAVLLSRLWTSTPSLDTTSAEAASSATPRLSASATPSAPSASLRPGFGWQLGRQYTYTLRYDTRDTYNTDAVGTVAGSIALDADLTIAAVAALESGGLRTRWRLSGIRHSDVTALGRPVAADPSALEGEIEVDVGPTGLAERVRLPATTPPLAQNALHALVMEVCMDVRPIRQWVAEERGVVGLGAGRYHRTSDEVRRARTGYRSLRALPATRGVDPTIGVDGEQVARFGGGVLREVDGREQVHATSPRGSFDSDRTLTLALVATGAAEDHPLGAHEERLAGDLSVGDAASRRALAARVGGLSAEVMLATVTGFDAAGQSPDHLAFLWRATGLLRLEPERCGELGAALLDPTTGPKARLLGLDLLASTGTREAQAALRSVLEGLPEPTMEEVSRLALLQRPEPASLALASSLARTESGEVQATARLALGAMAGFLDEADPARVLVLESLSTSLTDATTAEDRTNLVHALGNLGGAEVSSLVSPHARSESLELRLAVADALRKVDTPEADEILLGLLADPEPRVQAKALAALGAQPRTDRVASLVAATLTSGALAPENQGAALRYVAREPIDPALARLVAERLLVTSADPGIRAFAEGLLSTVGARG